MNVKMKTKKINKNTIEVDGVRYIKEDSRGWLEIPELGIEVEIEVHDKNKSGDKLNLSKREDELLTFEQCIFLANHPKYSKILKMDGSSDNDDFFIKQQFDLNRKNGYVSRFGAYSDFVYLYSNRDSSYSGSSLGVRFIRSKSK